MENEIIISSKSKIKEKLTDIIYILASNKNS